MHLRTVSALAALVRLLLAPPSAHAQVDTREFPPGLDLLPGDDPPCDQPGNGANTVCWCCVQAHTPEPTEGDPTTRRGANGDPIPAGTCALDCDLACGADSVQDLDTLRANECKAQAGNHTVIKDPVFAECTFTGNPSDRCVTGAPPADFKLFKTRFKCESLMCKCPPRVVRTGCKWKRKHGSEEIPLANLPLNALCSGVAATPCS